ncbi:MAG: TetR/AcrR family transcriptional regulator [Myxococcota bacterium]|nr:TetR/AcrR family transcriptional regulator [Myxococcota bacterium]
MPKQTFFNLPEPKRERILEQAVLEFSTQPYAQASLSAIVSRCGISKGSIYQYFDNKLDLYRWLIFEYISQLKLQHFREHAYDPQASFLDNLEAQLRQGQAWALARPRIASLGARLWDATSDPQLLEMQQEASETSVRWMRMLLLEARSKGQLREDLDLDMGAAMVSSFFRHAVMDILPQRVGVPMIQWPERPEVLAAFGPEQQERFARELVRFLRLGLCGR